MNKPQPESPQANQAESAAVAVRRANNGAERSAAPRESAASKHEPLPIPNMSTGEAALRSDVLGVNRPITFHAGNVEMAVQFCGSGAVDAPFVAKVAVGSATFWIGLRDWDRLPGAEEILDGGQLARLPLEILPAVLEAIFEQPLDALSAAAKAPCEVVEVAHSVDIITHFESLRFSLTSGEGEITDGFIAGDEQAMELLRRLTAAAPAQPALDPQQIVICGGVEIGRTSLTLDELAQLKLHDVVMIESSAFGDDATAVVSFGPQTAWKVAIENDSLTFVEPAELVSSESLSGKLSAEGGQAHFAQNTSQNEPVTDTFRIGSEPIDAEQPQVEIVFEKGRVSVTAAELTNLAGQKRAVAYFDQVTLSTNGAPFAKGELVQIGERRGVRLLSRPAPATTENAWKSAAAQ